MKVPNFIQNFKPIYLIYIALALLILWYLYTKVKALIKGEQSKNLVKSSEYEVVKSDISYADTQYKTWADALEVAMEGVGTTTSRVLSIMSNMKTRTDVLKLIQAFGVRDYNNLWWVAGSDNLAEWLQSDLSSWEIGLINKDFNSRGVNYQF
jgi:hypothetical protein